MKKNLTITTKIKMKKILLISAVSVSLFACNNAENKEATTEKKDSAVVTTTATTGTDSSATAPSTKEYKTKTGKTFVVVTTHPEGASLSNIKVTLKEVPGSEMSFDKVDPINKVMVDDLDADGFDEIYISTTSAGSGSYGNLYGVASNKDKSVSGVYMPTVEQADMAKGKHFEGYEGHDDFQIIENSVVRTFPIKADKATKRQVNYKMKAGEATFLFYIKNSTAY